MVKKIDLQEEVPEITAPTDRSTEPVALKHTVTMSSLNSDNDQSRQIGPKKLIIPRN